MRGPSRPGFCALILLISTSLFAEEPASVPPVQGATGLSVGFMSCYRNRLPLEDFTRLHPEVQLKEVPWGRNPSRCFDKPLPSRYEELPDVVQITVGRYSDDLIQLADRGLIEPLDDLLKNIGLDPKDLFPNALEAVTYRGHIWALPHHAVFWVLRGDRKLLGEAKPEMFSSWETLFKYAQEQAAAQEKRIPFSTPLSAAGFAEFMTMSAGGAGIDLADTAWVESNQFRDAISMVAPSIEKGAMERRQINQPLSLNATAVLGLDFLDSVHPDAAYAVYPIPSKLRGADPQPDKTCNTGVLEAFALKRGAVGTNAAAITFLQWITSPDTEWRVFEKTNELKPNIEWLFDTVHVPLRDTALKSIDFEYAFRKFPDYRTVEAWCRKTVFQRRPPVIEHAVREQIERAVDYRTSGTEWDQEMSRLKNQLQQTVRTTPVESAAYSGY